MAASADESLFMALDKVNPDLRVRLEAIERQFSANSDDLSYACTAGRRFIELLLVHVAQRHNEPTKLPDEGLKDIIDRLSNKGHLDRARANVFHKVRMLGNKVHGNATRSEAYEVLSKSKELASWFIESCAPRTSTPNSYRQRAERIVNSPTPTPTPTFQPLSPPRISVSYVQTLAPNPSTNQNKQEVNRPGIAGGPNS